MAAVGGDLHRVDAPSENIEERIADAADAVLTEQVNIEVEEAEGERPTDE